MTLLDAEPWYAHLHGGHGVKVFQCLSFAVVLTDGVEIYQTTTVPWAVAQELPSKIGRCRMQPLFDMARWFGILAGGLLFQGSSRSPTYPVGKVQT